MQLMILNHVLNGSKNLQLQMRMVLINDYDGDVGYDDGVGIINTIIVITASVLQIALVLVAIAFNTMAWYGMMWYGMVWYDVVWYGMV